jgi:hypothetical protein
MTAREFRLWLKAARRHERFTYFTGKSLAASSGGDAPRTKEQARFHALAHEVRQAYQAGLVHLVQARRTDGVRGFDYLAIKRI